MKKEVDKWSGCYEGGWNGVIVPEAFSQPAKFSYSLTERMFAHAISNGWISKGSVVVDPFGGVGTGGIIAAYNEIQWIGCELESRFIRLAEGYDCPGITKKEWARWYGRFDRNKYICAKCQGDIEQWYKTNSGIVPSRDPHRFIGNFDLHRRKWEGLDCPQPVIIQGDSREMYGLLRVAKIIVDCVISSPPFAEVQTGGGIAAAQQGTSDYPIAKNLRTTGSKNQGYQAQGQTPGQLGNLKPGDVDCVVSSPPYAESLQAKGDVHAGQVKRLKNIGNIEAAAKLTQKADYQSYSNTPGNLGNLKPGDVEMVVSSPPYEGSMTTANKADDLCPHDSTQRYERQYSKAAGNMGNQSGPTFWQAAKEIVQQCHQTIKPGGHAIWVVKSFVRKGCRVDFPGDWRRLCESVGFTTVCTHHAMLVKETKHNGLFGAVTERKERKSFFRRLAESKGSPAIDYEVILCIEK